jgi:hypothetical protein
MPYLIILDYAVVVTKQTDEPAMTKIRAWRREREPRAERDSYSTILSKSLREARRAGPVQHSH